MPQSLAQVWFYTVFSTKNRKGFCMFRAKGLAVLLAQPEGLGTDPTIYVVGPRA